MPKVTNNSKLLVVSLPDLREEEGVYSLIETHQDKSTRICYLLLRTAFFYMYDELKKRNLLSNLHVIDFFGEGSNPPVSHTKLTFLNNPSIPDILTTLDHKIKKDNCNLIIVDTINQLLHYHPRHEIQKLTNCLKTNDSYKDIKKFFLFSNKDELIQEENNELFNDLKLFADKVV